MKRRILIVFIFLTPNLFGQDVNLSGKVLDSATNKPVEGATVFVKEMNQTIFSDQKGSYSFALEKGKYQLQVYSLGSEMISQDVILRTDTVIDFYLQRLSKNLDEVEIASEKELTSGMTRMRSIEGFGIYAAKKNEVIVLDDFAANLVSNNARQVFAKIPGLNTRVFTCFRDSRFYLFFCAAFLLESVPDVSTVVWPFRFGLFYATGEVPRLFCLCLFSPF